MYNVSGYPCGNTSITCTATYFNGSCLVFVGLLGTALSSKALYMLLKNDAFCRKQRLYLLNVEISDVFLAVLGVIRGLAMLDPLFMGYDKDTGDANLWCCIYLFVGSPFWICTMSVLLPLTIDRFFALMLPMTHRVCFHKGTAKLMISLSWIPSIVELISNMCTFFTGNNEIFYKIEYHRCVFDRPNYRLEQYFVIVPFFLILAMYLVIIFHLFRSGVKSIKLLKFTSMIIGSSLLVNTSHQVMNVSFNIQMSYQVSTWLTIILFYTNSIWNPLIYIFSRKTCGSVSIRRNTPVTVSVSGSVKFARQAQPLESDVIVRTSQ